MVLGFLIGVQLARSLGVDGYGVYGLAMSMVSLASVPIEFGLPFLVTRETSIAFASRRLADVDCLVRWASRFIATGIAALFVLAGAYYFIASADTQKDVLFITLVSGFALLIPQALSGIRAAALRSMDRMFAGQVPELLIKPGIAALVLYLVGQYVPVKLTATLAMWVNVVAALVMLSVTATAFRLTVQVTQVRRPSTQMKLGWLRSAVPMAVTEALRVSHGHAAVIMLGLLGTTNAVGLFRVADSTALICAVPISLMNIVCAPLIARYFAEKASADLQRVLKLATLVMLVGVAALSVPIFTHGEVLLGRVFGSGFAQSLLALQVLCVGHVVSAAIGLSSTLLNMTGHERRVTWSLVVALLGQAVAGVALIPTFGIVGAAFANVFGLVLWNAKLWFDARRMLGIDTSVFSLFYSPAAAANREQAT